MEPRTYEAIAALSLRDVPRASPREVAGWLAQQPDLGARDRLLVSAAIAARAGAALTAVELLAGDDSALAVARRVDAHSAQRNRFPGGRGALLEDGDVESFIEPPVPDGNDAAEAVLTIAIAHVEAMVGNWRSISSGTAQGLPLALARDAQLHEVASSVGAGWLAAYLRLVEADLRRLAGDRSAADQVALAAIAEFEAANDALGRAACLLAIGDWNAAPASSPEALGLLLDATPPTPDGLDLSTARAMYAEARAVYAGSSELGLSFVLLREGHLARVAGDLDAWGEAAARAAQLADHADDRCLAALAATHAALATLESGGAADIEALAQRWTALLEGGNRSWVRGLLRMCLAHSTSLRDRGRFVGARRGLELATRLAEISDAPLELVDVTDRLLELYGRHSFPVARAVLGLAAVDQALAGQPRIDDPLVFAQLADDAMTGINLSTLAMDGDVLIVAAGLTERLLAAGACLTRDPAVDMLRAALVSGAMTSRTSGLMYQGRQARREGRGEEADALLAQALTELDASGADEPALRAVLLGALGRREEALPIVDSLREHGFDADDVARLYLRIDAPDRALEALGAAGVDDDGAWGVCAVRAEALVCAGRLDEAAAVADVGIAAFESALGRQARDVLKSSATESLDAADLYLARVMADLPAALGGDHDALRRSFATSDRARSISNSERISGLTTEGALRRWLALGSAWAANYEELGAMVSSLGDVAIERVRRRVREVEERLDDAEDELLSTDPQLLERLQSRRPPLDVDAVAAALPAGAALLQFHCWNDELVSWWLTGDELRVHHSAINGRALASDLGRFRAASAGRRPWRADLVDELSDLLLGPWRERLADHERIIVVPHAIVAGVPLHLLESSGRALAHSHVIAYSPSAAHVPHLAAGVAGAGTFVLGDPAYAPASALRRLPGSGVEAAAIGGLVDGAHVFVGGAATLAAVLEHAPGAAVLHFGTHGVLDDRWPNSGYLALAGDDRLMVGDLLGLDVDGALVVLSACNTGRGRATATGDIVGMIRAVLASGAGNVVASLWPVDDVVGCLVMIRFHAGLCTSAADDPAVALALAAREVAAMSPAERTAEFVAHARRLGLPESAAGQRDLRPEHDSPALSDVAAWAPFVYVGR